MSNIWEPLEGRTNSGLPHPLAGTRPSPAVSSVPCKDHLLLTEESPLAVSVGQQRPPPEMVCIPLAPR